MTCLPVLVALAIALPAHAQVADPIAPVRALDDGLLAIAKGAAQLGIKGRSERIGAVIDRVFDLPLMTRLSIGPAWATIAAADQAALIAAIRRLTVAQYAGNFDGGTGLAFAIDPKVETRGGDKLVRTTLTAPRQAPVAIAYRLRGTAQRWRVIDVYYQNSISQLATRRADFARVFAKGGARALIADLDRQAAKATR